MAQIRSISQKHRDFVAEPMGEKSVQVVAGIGPAIGGRLSEKGFDKAYTIFGQYLVFGKDKASFTGWLKEVGRANERYAGYCYNCLTVWCENHFH
nr:barrier-to-autointegration factor A-like [Lytechinus pictus]